MKLVKGDLVNNVLPILVKFNDGDEGVFPAMCLFSILKVNNDNIIVTSVIPKIDIELYANSKHFRCNTFAMRN